MKGRHSSEGVHDYDSADAYIEEHANDPNACHLPQSACLRRWASDKIVVLYRWTPIVTYFADGRITLKTGGPDERDEVMRDRLNSYTLPWCGVTEDWSVQLGESEFVFHEGFLFDARGPPEQAAEERHRRTTR